MLVIRCDSAARFIVLMSTVNLYFSLPAFIEIGKGGGKESGSIQNYGTPQKYKYRYMKIEFDMTIK